MYVDVMIEELVAWRNTEEELQLLGRSWDDPEMQRFHAKVILWAEILAALRATQDVGGRAQALRDAEQRVRLSLRDAEQRVRLANEG